MELDITTESLRHVVLVGRDDAGADIDLNRFEFPLRPSCFEFQMASDKWQVASVTSCWRGQDGCSKDLVIEGNALAACIPSPSVQNGIHPPSLFPTNKKSSTPEEAMESPTRRIE